MENNENKRKKKLGKEQGKKIMKKFNSSFLIRFSYPIYFKSINRVRYCIADKNRKKNEIKLEKKKNK